MGCNNVPVFSHRDLGGVEVEVVHGGEGVEVCGTHEGLDVHVMAVLAVGVDAVPDAGGVGCAGAGLAV